MRVHTEKLMFKQTPEEVGRISEQVSVCEKSRLLSWAQGASETNCYE